MAGNSHGFDAGAWAGSRGPFGLTFWPGVCYTFVGVTIQVLLKLPFAHTIILKEAFRG